MAQMREFLFWKIIIISTDEELGTKDNKKAPIASILFRGIRAGIQEVRDNVQVALYNGEIEGQGFVAFRFLSISRTSNVIQDWFKTCRLLGHSFV